jgi:dTDP-4-dehydrorhamnose 3,5-epimerase
MRVYKELGIESAMLFEPLSHVDSRGWFLESFNTDMQLDNFNIVQENHSFTKLPFTFRGFHHQLEPYSQNKLIRCIKGKILDIIIDLRPNSSTYLKSYSIELSHWNRLQLFIPSGCFHGFLTLSEDTEIVYKVDKIYNKDSEIILNPLDPFLTMIDWKDYKILNLSTKDKDGNKLIDILEMLR